MRFYTETDKDVTLRIKDGKTKFFHPIERQKAYEFARQTGSYLYDVFSLSKDNKKVMAGYAVPK